MLSVAAKRTWHLDPFEDQETTCQPQVFFTMGRTESSSPIPAKSKKAGWFNPEYKRHTNASLKCEESVLKIMDYTLTFFLVLVILQISKWWQTSTHVAARRGESG